jgi:uncharacterized protein (DUF1501 family)
MNDKNILIIINLRGGADGLNMVAPYRESDYYSLRPTIAIPEPGRSGKTLIDLDGFFGLHPSLSPLMKLYEKGSLAFLHATGWPGSSHSHFQAWEEIESGVVGKDLPTTGWLARFLQLQPHATNSPLRAVAFGGTPSRLLMGTVGATTLRSLDEFRLSPFINQQNSFQRSLLSLYSTKKSALGNIAIHTLEAMDSINNLLSDRENKKESNYPNTSFGKHLMWVEQLIRSGIGIEAASVDLNGWDTHILQGAAEGYMANLLGELASGLNTFINNLDDQMDHITLIVMSEFGRRAMENGSGGTDHGQGGVMIFCGGKVRGGKVYGRWPGLGDSHLAGPGDLSITTDFRDAIGELISSLSGEKAIETVFPGYNIVNRNGFIKS